ncbi:hypothetical protein BRADI_4g21386v3 [Brachypodium distachyon]|uniref:Uncharacterized protein n=1 Tax=Brachypodium distachyon TaxID=15368 RepID=A0A0Q3ER84_BRADI|nr:hypothetical protein BRADI_4g21386v3 [Brachypodium distachyon]
MTVMPPNIVGMRLTVWEYLCAKLVSVQLDDQPNSFCVVFFRVAPQNLYDLLINTECQFRHKVISKLKIPLKIKFFAWFLCPWVVLTKDNCLYDVSSPTSYLYY